MAKNHEIISKIEGLRAYGDPDGAALWRVNGRLVIRVWNQGGHDLVDLDVMDLQNVLPEIVSRGVLEDA